MHDDLSPLDKLVIRVALREFKENLKNQPLRPINTAQTLRRIDRIHDEMGRSDG